MNEDALESVQQITQTKQWTPPEHQHLLFYKYKFNQEAELSLQKYS